MKKYVSLMITLFTTFIFTSTASAIVKVGGYPLNEKVVNPSGQVQLSTKNFEMHVVNLDKSADKIEKKWFTDANIPVSPLVPTSISLKGTVIDQKECFKAQNDLENYFKDKYKMTFNGWMDNPTSDLVRYNRGRFTQDGYVYELRLMCFYEPSPYGGMETNLYYEIKTMAKTAQR